MENEVQTTAPITQPIVQSPTPVQPTPKKSNWLKIFLFTILGILFLTGAVYAGIQIGKGQTSSQQPIVTQSTTSPTTSVTATPTVDPTADWKTYKNIALGFELKYPPFVEIDLEMNDQHNRSAIFKGGNIYIEVMLRKAGDTPLDKYYYMDNPGFTKSVIDGKTANVYTYDASKNSCVSDGSGPGCPLSYVTYVAQNGLDLYHFSFFGDSILSDTEKKILSTFKFLNTEKSSAPSKIEGYIRTVTYSDNRLQFVFDQAEWIENPKAPNGYEIKNPFKDSTTFVVDPKAKIIMQTYSHTSDGNFNSNQQITQAQFKMYIESLTEQNPFFTVELDPSTKAVTKITEKYQP